MNFDQLRLLEVPDVTQKEAIRKANKEKAKQIVIETFNGYLIVSVNEYINQYQMQFQPLAFALPQI